MYYNIFSTIAIFSWALCDDVVSKNTRSSHSDTDDIIYDYEQETKQVTPHVDRSKQSPTVKHFVQREVDMNQVKDVLQQLFAGRFTENQFPLFFTSANLNNESLLYEVTNKGFQISKQVGLTAHPSWLKTTVNNVKVVPKVKLVTKKIQKSKKRFAPHEPYDQVVKPARIKLGQVLMTKRLNNITKSTTDHEEEKSKGNPNIRSTLCFRKEHPTLTPFPQSRNNFTATRTDYRRKFVDKLKYHGKTLLFPEKNWFQREGETDITETVVDTEIISTDLSVSTETNNSLGDTDSEIGTTESVETEIAVGTETDNESALSTLAVHIEITSPEKNVSTITDTTSIAADTETDTSVTTDNIGTTTNYLNKSGLYGTDIKTKFDNIFAKTTRKIITTTNLSMMTSVDLSSLLEAYERTRPRFDIPALLDIIANLTYDYEVNLTQRLNETLRKMSVPSCSTDLPRITPASTTPLPDLNNEVIQKCFVCGMDMKGIPESGRCADAFATDFLQLTPVDPTARGHIAKFRKYCRWKNVHNYWVNVSDPRSVYGRWSGGCAVRWIDLSGLYTQRTCRNKDRATMGNHFLSKRMAKLEMALTGIQNGCIVSPLATLVPFSRAVSLYARFHACVCTGNWCNEADSKCTGSLINIVAFFLLISWQNSLP